MADKPAIYLDHHATTPMPAAVWEAMRPYWAERFGNPSSAHSVGRRARRAMDDARERIAARLGAQPDEVIFTSGATEANNFALFGLAGDPPGTILTSPIEHPCVVEPVAQLERRGHCVVQMTVDEDGVVQLPETMPSDARLVALMRVNHETGVVQPLVPLGPWRWHTDAAQCVGKLPVDFAGLGATSLSLSGHKFGGPPGIGALLLRRETRLRPLTFGGHQQQGRRPGTEAVALAVGMATALELACDHMAEANVRVAGLRKRLSEILYDRAAPVVVNGAGSPYVLNASFPGLRADALLVALDLAGVACSTGSACSSGSLLPSPVLRAMGVPDAVLRSALRFSFGTTTTMQEIEMAAERITLSAAHLRAAVA